MDDLTELVDCHKKREENAYETKLETKSRCRIDCRGDGGDADALKFVGGGYRR
jgi:hypothetical protein